MTQADPDVRKSEGDRRAQGGCPQAPRPHTLRVKADEVHLWLACIALDPVRVETLMALLSEDEKGRAERLVFERDRERFIAAHGILRRILAACLGLEPGAVTFRANALGKPSLAGKGRGRRLRFNMSHSHGLALYALALDREVGVDVERIRSERDHERIAERFFSAREVKALRALPEDARREAFFKCWTRKEAFVKATGMGMSLRLDRFDVSVAPGEAAELLRVDEGLGLGAAWALHDIDVGCDYAAALCVEGKGATLRLRRWGELL